MHLNYRFFVHRLGSAIEGRFQLRVGLEGEEQIEFMPVHCTAFAQQISLKADHETEEEAHLELGGLLAWINARAA